VQAGRRSAARLASSLHAGAHRITGAG
jgi:hypothetical protein